MSTYYVIKDLQSEEYFYGFYSNKKWTKEILEAKTFDNKNEAVNMIDLNKTEFLRVYQLVKVYTN